jgi:hypothetical protein
MEESEKLEMKSARQKHNKKILIIAPFLLIEELIFE